MRPFTLRPIEPVIRTVMALMVCVLLAGGVSSAAFAQGLTGGNPIPKAGPVTEGKGGASTESAPAGISSTSPLLPFDVVQVSVFQEPELETRARVTEDGSVVLPLIGSRQTRRKNAEKGD